MNEVQELVKTVKKKHKLTCSQLATLLGVHATSVYRWNQGNTKNINPFYVIMMKAFSESNFKNTKQSLLFNGLVSTWKGLLK